MSLKQGWHNYVRILRDAFWRMTAEEKQAFLRKVSTIITVGVGTLSIVVFYPLIPPHIRLVVTPLWLLMCWFLGDKVVTSVVLARLELRIEDTAHVPIEAKARDKLMSLPPRQRMVLLLRASRLVFLGVGALGIAIAYPLITTFPAWIAAAQVFYLSWCLAGLAVDIILRNWLDKD